MDLPRAKLTFDEYGNPVCNCGYDKRLPLSEWVVSWTVGGYSVCPNCGVINWDDRETIPEDTNYEKSNPYAKWWKEPGIQCTMSGRGRYKEKFHYNERVSQWLMRDPSIGDDAWKRIKEEAKSGQYGAEENFSRSTVITLLRRLHLQKYRERWKTLLRRLNRDYSPPDVESEVIEWSVGVFDAIITTFIHHKKTMPESVVRTKDGQKFKRQRHNFISYNYTQRKILEIRELLDYHSEFPVPRSHEKLHALDDVMMKIMDDLGLPFSRSTVIKRPKIRKRKFL